MENYEQRASYFLDSQVVSDAMLYLNFAVQKGINIDKDVIDGIIAVSGSKDVTREQKNSFYSAYNRLGKALQPTDLESLKEATRPYKENPRWYHYFYCEPEKSRAINALIQFRDLTCVFLVVLIIVQVTWFYGNIIVDEVNRVSLKTQEDRMELTKLSMKEKKSADDTYRATIIKLEMQDLAQKYMASYLALKNWLKVILFRQDESVNRTIAAHKDREILEPLIVVKKSQYIIQVLQLYILPLLYGLIGACAYVLRAITIEINKLTYKREASAAYFSRIVLGGLSGLAIGWFIEPSSHSMVTSLSPFALAFVAGYSVELLFSIIDRIINAFTVSASKHK